LGHAIDRSVGLAVTFTDLNFPSAASKFDDDGNLINPAYNNRIKGFLDELVWMASTLRCGRNNVPSKFHS
jgi:hypothetical protein